MTNYATRSPEEIKTLELINGYLEKPAVGTYDMAVGMVFKARHSSTFDLARIIKIAEALSCIDNLDPERVKKSLSGMVRAKVLRSRRVNGRTFYEVNY